MYNLSLLNIYPLHCISKCTKSSKPSSHPSNSDEIQLSMSLDSSQKSISDSRIHKRLLFWSSEQLFILCSLICCWKGLSKMHRRVAEGIFTHICELHLLIIINSDRRARSLWEI